MARRRIVLIAAMAGLALTAGAIGALTHRATTAAQAASPFAYFPS